MSQPGKKYKADTNHIEFERVEELAARGMTYNQIADALGICTKTLMRHRRKTPDIEEMIKRGRAKGIAQVSDALFRQALSGNVTAQIFWLKINAGWKETTVVENVGKDGAPLIPMCKADRDKLVSAAIDL